MGALNSRVRSYQVEGEPVAKANQFFGLRTSSETVRLDSRELSWSANDGFKLHAESSDSHSMTAVLAGVLDGMVAAKSARR